MDWYQVKLAALEATGLSRDALHIVFGTGGQLLAAIVLRRTLASPLPWLCVLIAEAANEWWDLSYENWHDSLFAGSLQDLWVTMLLPTLLLLIARYFPQLMVREAAQPLDAEVTREDAERTL